MINTKTTTRLPIYIPKTLKKELKSYAKKNKLPMNQVAIHALELLVSGGKV